MNLEDLVISKIRQSQKDKYCMSPVFKDRDRKQAGGCQGLRQQE